jgi:hypothetical protein
MYLKPNLNGRTKLGGNTIAPKGIRKPKYRMRTWNESRNNKEAVVVALAALAITADLT